MTDFLATKVQVGVMTEKINDLIDVVRDVKTDIKDVKTTVYEVRDNQRDQAYELKDVINRVTKIEPVVETLNDNHKISKGAMMGAGACGAIIMGFLAWCAKWAWAIVSAAT